MQQQTEALRVVFTPKAPCTMAATQQDKEGMMRNVSDYLLLNVMIIIIIIVDNSLLFGEVPVKKGHDRTVLWVTCPHITRLIMPHHNSLILSLT